MRSKIDILVICLTAKYKKIKYKIEMDASGMILRMYDKINGEKRTRNINISEDFYRNFVKLIEQKYIEGRYWKG